jgi:hypothetical protein
MDKNYLLDIMVSVRERNIDVNEAVKMVCALENVGTGDRQLTIPDVRLLLANFVNWYNNDKDCHCELVNEDIELFISAYKA